MKNIVWLVCVLSLSYSCKQTQLSSNFNKRSKKIYVKPIIKNHYIDVTTSKEKTVNYSKRKSIETIVKNSFNSIEITNKEELLANVDFSEKNGFLKEKKIQQKLIRVDSILKSNDSTLKEEDILKLSKKAKNFSLIGLLTGLVSLFFIESVGGLLLLISGLLSLIGFFYLLNTRKKIKKNVQYQNMEKSLNDKVKSNILISTIISSITLLPLLIFVAIAICLIGFRSNHHLGGITGDVLGAIAFSSELLFLLGILFVFNGVPW